MKIPTPIADFLACKSIAVAGVSRNPNQPANTIFRRLRESGYNVYPTNPNCEEVENTRCYASIADIPDPVEAVVVVTHPDVALDVVRQSVARGAKHLWFHRSFGQGSVSPEAVAECERSNINYIAGGCPMMFCEPVDIAHRCMRWVLQKGEKIPS